MRDPFDPKIAWIAQRHGQDWRDEAILTAADWLEALVPSADWRRRIDAVETRFQAAKVEWAQGRRVPLFDPKDSVAWYLHQARRYADPAFRADYFLPEGYRIAPVLRRIGQILPDMAEIGGAEDRALRLMTENLSQPDDGLYELLVAGAYRRRGWDKVSFVPEAKGISKTQDLLVERPRSRWAVECKRAGRSGYARDERLAGERIARHAHELAAEANRSLLSIVRYREEIHRLPDDYLASKVSQFLAGRSPFEWNDEGGEGIIAEVPWEPLRSIMAHDDIFFGSTRMFELIIGEYDPAIDFTMEGDWEPGEGRPLHATWVDRVSLIAWRSVSDEAARRKAMHFRGLVSRAASQLPGDLPGVVHVGYEAAGGNSADGRRHHLNREEMRTFDSAETGLRMVYGNYFMCELVTSRNESAAVTETTAWYPPRGRRGEGPLPRHLLFKDEDGTPGSHLR